MERRRLRSSCQSVVSNSQNPALFGQVHVHGENGASIGVQTDGGAMFIAGMSGIAEPPYNDMWTVKGEESLLEKWKREDADFFGNIDPTSYFHERAPTGACVNRYLPSSNAFSQEAVVGLIPL